MQTAIALVVAWAVCPGLQAMTANQQFVGRAYGETGELLYEEHHLLEGRCESGQWTPDRHTVRYLAPDGQAPFATKTLHYSRSLLRPEVDFHQPRWNERLLIGYDSDDNATITWRKGDHQKEQANFPPTADLVFDAGFDHLVRQSWDRLRRGQPVMFRFLAPTRGRSYDFLLEADQPTTDDGGMEVVIRPEGWVTRLLVAPIELRYDQRGFLVRFDGLTNIRQTAEANFNASIRYQLQQIPNCPLLR
ncbi:MAG: hypothetical protein R3175_03025 [Marinobacter sp.]|uniref:hypothetical protein n=1 Tax=Marinobacter sp. TaxID=50741 RepID=UPI00299CE3D7|nr:hypothetical protein [Marinobacter sp.]MDX1755011.1 hypothetical protein [Marinobacter sp.]